MIIEFKVKNFRSIREEQTLDFTKVKGDELVESNTFVPKMVGTATPLLRSLAVYGPNASGKTNLLKAIGNMRRIVVDSASGTQRGNNIVVEPFLFDIELCSEPTEFEVMFITEGVKYQYGFSATRSRVIDEWLFAWPKGRPQRWIDRSYDADKDSYDWGSTDSLSGQKKLWQESTRSNALFLSTAVQLNNQQLRPVFDWFDDNLQVVSLNGWTPVFSAHLCEKENSKKSIIDFLQAADIDIDDIRLEKSKFKDNLLDNKMPDQLKDIMIKAFSNEDITTIHSVHSISDDVNVEMNLDEESDGTQKLFFLAGPWLDTLKKGLVLVVDELHDNLHPHLVRYLLGLFHDPRVNKNNAQLLFTTHETSVLSQDAFRRDQIWFCEKGEDKGTKLFPLTDFSPRKGAENLERSYLSGRYGALPYFRKIDLAMNEKTDGGK